MKKRIFSIVLAALMLLGIMSSVFAADVPGAAGATGKTVTINNTDDGHTYEAYQLFTGDLVNTAAGTVLTNAQFGTGLNYSTAVGGATLAQALDAKWNFGLTALQPDFSTATAADLADYAEAVLAAIGELSDADGPELADIINVYLTSNVYASADTKTADQYKITGLADGYYFIKDQDGSLPHTPGVNDKAYTDFILQVVKDVEVDAKADAPDISKKIVETKDIKTGELKQYEINGVKQYHLRNTSENGNNEPLYYQLDTNGNPIVGPDSHTTTDTGFPVPTHNATGGKDHIALDPIYCDANGDFYALRVNENTASIGEWVRYEIIGTVPNMNGYDKYYYIMNDTLCPGLTLPTDAFTGGATSGHPLVIEMEYADGYREALTLVDGSAGTPVVTTGNTKIVYYIRTDNADGTTDIELIYNNFIQYNTPNATHGAAVDVVVTYDVLVNANAIIGNPGNPNIIDLTYSRNPNIKPDGENDQNKPSSRETEITGKTPEKKVITYITELILKKVDEATGAGLAGAQFKVTGTRQVPIKTVTEEYLLYTDANSDGYDDTKTDVPASQVTYYKLKDGTFTDQAPTFDTVDNTNPSSPVTIYGNYPSYEDYTGTVTDGVPSITYASQAEVDAAIKPAYFHYVTTTISYDPAQLVNLTLTVGADGILDLSGLGAGDYVIEETRAPEGYNILRDKIYVNIEFNTDNSSATDSAATDNFTAQYRVGESGTWTNISAGEPITIEREGKTINLTDNYWLLEIGNKKGSELPTTGGIGTTIFYIVGTILLVAAAVVLITRRRMAVKNNNK